MRSNRSARPLTIGIIVACLVATSACQSDGGPDDSFGSGPPPTAAESMPSTMVETTESPTEPTTRPPTGDDTTAPTVPAPLVEPVVSLLDIGTFDQPVDVTHRPGDTQIYVVEQPGRVVAATDEGSEVVLDITDRTNANGEQGLLGLAFHPTADLAYVNYIDGSGDTVVAEFSVDPSTGQFDPASFREVLAVDQPYSNHNGGKLAFGPDELLYIGLGDGGSGGDPRRLALDLGSRLGKILRIDPVAAGDQPFSAPPDNPFVGTPGADPTIWSYGLRNPWRFSFDQPTGDLWIADVGQGNFEEINHSTATNGLDAAKGVNYGWSAVEGYERFNQDQSADGAVAPIFVYDHSDGRCSVSGGVVARGTTVPGLAGWYVFGDYCTGQIWALDPTAPASTPRTVQIAELGGLAAIAEGPDRELYAVSNAGTVARIVPA
jgi:glucose/arabinose dehydrogenase